MRLTLRFSLFFLMGLILFFFGLGLFVAFMLEVVIPLVAGGALADDTAVVLVTTVIPFLITGYLFSLYFVAPMVQILKMIGQLSDGNYRFDAAQSKIYTRRGKLRRRYRLYREVLTDLRGLAESLEQSKTQRRELEETKRSWIAGVSHDLKTPLTYIKGYSALLLNREHANSADEQQRFAEQIYDKSLYISELLEDLNLSFKMEDGGVLPVNAASFDLVDLLQRLTAETANDPRAADYDLGFLCECDQLAVHADRGLLQRAVQNLLMNAVLHNPVGTEILVSVQKETDSACVEVSDNGKGISADDLPHIFERYYRTDPKSDTNFSGGVGLSVVKSIVEAHRGTIACISTVGAGTTFRFHIPNA